ncbi:MAG: N-glycosylase/DNA lyase [Promethearchaeota archaeon]|nr:MAG: N-glycosylase/DNA lyase [Candidatus Lokiarchaeota archaeon]
MQDLLDRLQYLKNSEIKSLIDTRLAEFSIYRKGNMDEIFCELSFCITTANCSAERCIEVQEKIGEGFLTLSEIDLATKFKEIGYRFPNVRSKYIIEARKNISYLHNLIKSGDNGNELREWIVKNIKGLGYKESSHFLRNIGYKNYAIIDFHIIDLLVSYNLIEKPKTLTKSKYLEIEEILKDIGNKLKLNLAELDLYLWYLETGKILK